LWNEKVKPRVGRTLIVTLSENYFHHLQCEQYVVASRELSGINNNNQQVTMKKIRSPWKTAGVAGLTAGLISTWDVGMAQTFPPGSMPAAPLTFTGEITPTHDLTAVYFLFAAGPCAPAYSKKIADFIPANTTTDFNITLNSIYAYSDANGNTVWVGDRFSVIGLYDSVNGGVSLGFDPTQGANILAESPALDFNGSWTIGYGSTGDESLIASRLQSGIYNGASLDDSSAGGLIDPNASVLFWLPDQIAYYSQISTDPLAPAAFTLVDFSGASAGGSGFVVEVVPEPATVSFLAAGALLFSAGRFWRRAKG
jgi:hypothetical protein